jgi:hypothetical protein
MIIEIKLLRFGAFSCNSRCMTVPLVMTSIGEFLPQNTGQNEWLYKNSKSHNSR